MYFQKIYVLVPSSSYFCWCQHFLATNQRFLAKIVPLLKKIVWELCYRCFSSVFSFCKAKGYCLRKYNYASGIWLLCFSKLAVNWKNNNDVKIFQHELSSNFFDVVLFLLSSLVAGPRFMSVSSLVLEILQFSFIRDWAKIWKLEIPLSEFCPIFEDWGEWEIPNLARTFLIKCY